MRILLILSLLLLIGESSAGQQSLPGKYLREQNYFAGQWQGTGNIGDDAAKISFTARWVPGKHCLVIHGRTAKRRKEPFKWTILSGCDVQTGEMVDCYFATDGISCITRWKTLSDKEQAGRESGVEEGKPYSVECKAIKTGPDSWTFSSTTTDGKPVKIEYERVVRTSSVYGHLKFLDSVLGNWRVVTKEGDKVISDGQEASEWILNKSFMRHTGWGHYEGEPVRYEFVTGWNPKTGKVFQWAIGATDSDYGITWRSGNYNPDERVWASQGRLLLGDGKPHDNQVNMKFVDDSTITIDFLKRRSGDEDLPNQFDTFTRAPAAAPPMLDKAPGQAFEQLKFLDFSVGKWKLEGSTPDGQPYVGEEVNEWVYDKNFTRTSGWGRVGEGERIEYEAIMGWDPAKKKMFMRLVASDGSFATREGTYDAEENCVTSKQVTVDPTGVESSGTVIEQYIDKDHFVLKFSETTEGAKRQPDSKVTVTRLNR